MTSDALIAMIERKLQAYGLEKVVPDEDLLAETYRAFHRSQRLRERFKAMEQEFDKEAAAADIPEGLEQRVREVLAEHADLRWDEAIQVVLDQTQISHVRAEKEKAQKKSGDFTSHRDGGARRVAPPMTEFTTTTREKNSPPHAAQKPWQRREAWRSGQEAPERPHGAALSESLRWRAPKVRLLSGICRYRRPRGD